MMFVKWLLIFVIASVVAREGFCTIFKSHLVAYYPIFIKHFEKLYVTKDRSQKITDKNENERVIIQVYYECLCPACRKFNTKQLKDAVLKLDKYLDVYMYPYGNAETFNNNGQIEFKCQHGPHECYGNKLHACAIDYLQNTTASVCFNACMMEQSGAGSDDKAADKCGKSLGVDSEPIKFCAKGDKGTLLLEYYGEESKKAKFPWLPHILINGVKNDGANFMLDICKIFNKPPLACKSLLH